MDKQVLIKTKGRDLFCGETKSQWSKLRILALMSVCFPVLLMAIIFCLALPRATLWAPEHSYLILDTQQRFIAQLSSDSDRGYGFWPVEVWPERLVNATLALEDKRFWTHPGIDFKAVVRAFIQNITSSQTVSGASTIAMQIARMQQPAKRTYFNKAVEGATALLLTARYSRQEIILHYLRLVPYGNQIYGASYAAKRYFNKSVQDLSWAEIALLSAIPQSPTLNNPLNIKGRKRAQKRALRIVEALLKQNLMTTEQYELALIQIQAFSISIPQRRDQDTLHAIFKLQKKLEASRPASPVIQSHLDLKLQHLAVDTVQKYVSQWRNSGAEHAAAIILENKSNRVRAWVGSPYYFNADAGSIDYTQIKRSSGSTLKPFIYALAMENKRITPGTILADLPSQSHGFSNSDHLFLGPLLPRYALANSRNIPAISLIEQLGIEQTYDFLHQLSLHENAVAASFYGAGIAIGSLPVTLEAIVRAYSVLANGGLLRPIEWYNNEPLPRERQLLSSEVARQMALFLSDPLARLPSFPRMGTLEYPFSVAIKTGTSQGYRDAWALAFSKHYTLGVWVGRSDAKPMRALSGAAAAAPIAQALMLALHNLEGTERASLQFLPPEGFLSVNVCSLTGKRVFGGHCPNTTKEWFSPGTVPSFDQSFQMLNIDQRNGLLAGQWTPEAFVKSRLFTHLPAQFVHWGKAQGYMPSPSAYSPLNHPDKRFNFHLGTQEQIRKAIGHSNQVANGGTPKYLTILSPKNNVKLATLPEVPDRLNTLVFHLEANVPINEVLWYVNGVPFALSHGPTYRWPMLAGQHKLHAELPYYGVRSQAVTVHVNE